MVNAEFVFRAFIGMLFESFVLLIALLLCILCLQKYFQKKHKLTLYLLVIFIALTCAVLFSWISKILVITIGLEYSHVPDFEPVENNLYYWFLLRITDFRISFIFMTIAIYFTYVLKVNLYEDGYNSKMRIFIIIFSILTATFSFFVYIRGVIEIDAVAFFLIFFLLLLVYLPFSLKSYRAYKNTEEHEFKKGFLALAIMGIAFISIFLNFFIDRILVMIPGLELGFSTFYYLAWISAIIGLLSAYFGFVKPRSTA
ncbi:MAG: hypothetical protein JW891_18945 [Candidatus Lokiarchaeota archaeon]|nr:hypothetical protein [Candidatus Lokiarchaeota archaeon]